MIFEDFALPQLKFSNTCSESRLYKPILLFLQFVSPLLTASLVDDGRCTHCVKAANSCSTVHKIVALQEIIPCKHAVSVNNMSHLMTKPTK